MALLLDLTVLPSDCRRFASEIRSQSNGTVGLSKSVEPKGKEAFEKVGAMVIKMIEQAIEFQNVTYSYGKGTPFYRVAVDHVSLSIPKGMITGIIGHTGSGKSTVLQMMNGLLRPEEGTVKIFEKDLWEKPKKIREAAFKVGLVFQYPEYQLFEETVYKDISYGPKNMGLKQEEIDRRVRMAMEFVGMGEEFLEKSPFDLSGGQKRRAAMAGIIAMEPEIMVFDEPAAGLDPKGREEIFGNICSFQKTTGRTVVIVSHSMEDMAKYAQELIAMSGGRAVSTGACHEVFRQKELLASIGLNVPEVTHVMERLKELGMPVSADIFTVKEAVKELLPLLKRGEKV